AAAKAALAGKSAGAGSGALIGGSAMKITAVVVLATAAATATVVAPRLMSQEGNGGGQKGSGLAGSGLAGSGLSGGSKGGATKPGGAGNDRAALGSMEFGPSANRPVGWRGDGTGRYPGATPPVTWDRKHSGESKNILWAARLPSIGASSPIVVGGRIFVTCETHDLVCIEKASGRVLWIKSAPEFEGLTEEERKASPDFDAKCAPLSAQLEKLNVDAVTALNTNGGKGADGILQKRKEVQKQLHEAMKAIDNKKFDRYWAQGIFGWAGQTPVSDGKYVCAFYTTGVSACYDLDGNRKWIAHGRGGGSEHGNFASPILVAGKLVVWANEMRAYDLETGKLAWSNPAKGSNTYGSMFRVDCGGEPVAAFQCGYFTRIRDGKAIWGENIFGDSVETPVVENGMIYANVGYPRNAEGLGFKAFKLPANTESGKPTAACTFKTDWADDEVPVVKGKSDFDRGYVASPLYHEGLVYRMTEGGGLIVNDAATGAVAYRKVLPVKPITKYWDWAGASVSPTFAGKYIYLSDNQGVTVVIEPGRQYKEVARNVLEDTSDGRKQSQNLATPFFEGTRMYYRAPAVLYCIGEK
ncbi:MAG: PQQ-binding-like beta-propeller repeat protein, partial [Planctomycetota bacterium]|nr:PQQ-binding-like beta-propeller repeat protein [Planctomycetota bacterium]